MWEEERRTKEKDIERGRMGRRREVGNEAKH